MNMWNDYDTFDEVDVIRIEGDLNVASADGLRERVYSALAQRRRKLLLNLNDVVRIDAAGLGALAHVRQMAAIVDAVVTLTDVNPRVRELIVLVGLGAHLDIVASESDGLEDFEPCGARFRN